MRFNYKDISDAYDSMGGCGPAADPYAVCAPPTGNTARTAILGLGRTCIEGCKSEKISVKAQAPSMLCSIYIPESAAFNVGIVSFSLGMVNLFANCEEVPAMGFSCCETDENSLSNEIVVPAGVDYCIEIFNGNKGKIEFTGYLKVVICSPCN